jgi:hypothetical protein
MTTTLRVVKRKEKKQTSGRILYRREKEQEKIVIYIFYALLFSTRASK